MSSTVSVDHPPFPAAPWALPPADAIAVIFISGRSENDADGYAQAAQAMDAAARKRDGWLGIDSARDALTGVGITVSWWRDEAAALAWRNDPEHTRIRELGRDRWYDWYRVVVSTVERAYAWHRHTD